MHLSNEEMIMRRVAVVVTGLCIAVIVVPQLSVHAPAAPAGPTTLQSKWEDSDPNLYYSRVYTGKLTTSNVSYRLTDLVPIVGKCGDEALVPTGRGSILGDPNLTIVVVEEPDVLVPGRRYLVMEGRSDRKDRKGLSVILVRILDCEKKLEEGRLRDRFRYPRNESTLPPLDLRVAMEEDLQAWIAKVQESVKKGGVSIEDIAGILGEPEHLEYDPNCPTEAEAEYLIRENRKLIRVTKEGDAETQACPRLKFAVSKGQVKSAAYDTYTVTRIPGSHVVF